MSSDDAGKPIPLFNRRDFFARALLLGAAVGGSGWVLSACTTAYGASGGKADGASEPVTNKPAPELKADEASAAQLDCSDTTGLTPGEVKIREQLQYVDQTPKPEQNCANCLHWKPVSDQGCGGCAIMAGQFHPKGWCVAWVATR